MKCAMALHNPYEDDVMRRVLLALDIDDPTVVPLCQFHTECWDEEAGPFAAWSERECLKWAEWAAARAKRQEARTA
jgi:hypothetical protein